MSPIRRVAVIGAGPAGAIAVDALARELTFDVIRVFERREKAGGCWIYDSKAPPPLGNFSALAARTADPPLADIPQTLPAYRDAPTHVQHRYAETPVYGYLETNVDTSVMEYTQEPIPALRSAASIELHGPSTPFRHHSVISQWIAGLFKRRGYEDMVEFNTTVERAEKTGEEWKLTLRRSEGEREYWWSEMFDAVVVASGHYSVPYIPHIEGLTEFEETYPGSVNHSKYFRNPQSYRGKRVVVVGASVSAADIATDISLFAAKPVTAVVRGRYNAYFGDTAFRHPHLQRRPEISHISPATRTVHFVDGTALPDVDNILFGTGYSWTLPFLQIPIRNNRIPDLYLHIFHSSDPTLAFVGAIGAGFTFRAFEWQAVYIARVFAGRAQLAPRAEQEAWEKQRIAERGDGAGFAMLNPDFEEYFERLRELSGEEGPGRKLPRFRKEWARAFQAGHDKRIAMWTRRNQAAVDALQAAAAARPGRANL